MSQEEYIEHLVEREIATAQEAVAGMVSVPDESDPMSPFLPWVVAATAVFAFATTAASLAAVIFY